MITEELKTFIDKMRAAGKSPEEISAQLKTAGWQDSDISVALNPPAPMAAPQLNYTGAGRRLVAHLIDLVIAFLGMGYILAVIFGQTTKAGFSLTGFPALVFIVLMFAYFILFEFLLGASPGKMVLKLKVVKEDGTRCDFQAALIRNVLRIVDSLPFFYIVGIILIGRSDKKQRLGDSVAHTVVVGK